MLDFWGFIIHETLSLVSTLFVSTVRSAYLCFYSATQQTHQHQPPLAHTHTRIIQTKCSLICLFIITNTSLSQEWEAHHGMLELWSFLWIWSRSLYPAMKSQQEKKKMNKIKWRFCWHICGGLLRCQLAAMAMMTYWQRLCRDTPSSIALLGLGQEISALELRQGKSRGGWWRLRASWMRMDEDIWLSAVRGLSGSVRNPHGRVEKTIGAWSQSANVAFLTCIPYHLLFFFSERNPWYFCLRVSPECF